MIRLFITAAGMPLGVSLGIDGAPAGWLLAGACFAWFAVLILRDARRRDRSPI